MAAIAAAGAPDSSYDGLTHPLFPGNRVEVGGFLNTAHDRDDSFEGADKLK